MSEVAGTLLADEQPAPRLDPARMNSPPWSPGGEKESFVIDRSPILVPFLFLVVALSSPAWGQEATDSDRFDRSGPYASVLGVGAIETFDNTGPFDFSNGGGFNVRVGYRVLPHFAGEMQFEYVTGFSDQGIDIDIWNLMWNAKAFLLTERWQPYALFGMGVAEAEASGGGNSIDEDDFAIRVGGGLDFYATGNVVLTVESAWIKPTDDIDDVNYVTIGGGIQYRF